MPTITAGDRERARHVPLIPIRGCQCAEEHICKSISNHSEYWLCQQHEAIALALAAVREEAEQLIAYYREREEYFARVLHVTDGGQYRSDWDSVIGAVLTERDVARAAVRVLRAQVECCAKDCALCGTSGVLTDTTSAARAYEERIAGEMKERLMPFLHHHEVCAWIQTKDRPADDRASCTCGLVGALGTR